MASKLACILKLRADGSTKVRFIIDLLRSGVNGLCKVPQRVVLPRVQDVAEDVLDLLECQYNPWLWQADASGMEDLGVEMGCVDFTDAFYTLHACENEQGYFAFVVDLVWHIFTRIPFGLVSAPLLWARVAASACRLAQCMFRPHELRLQCYVDDPAFAVAGPAAVRRHLVGLLLLFWSILGLKLSWAKGSFGTDIEWIGVRMRLARYRGHPALRAELSEKRVKDTIERVRSMRNSSGMIDIKSVENLAGLLGWVGGLFAWVRAFNQFLWAAIMDHRGTGVGNRTGRKRPTHLMFLCRISQALVWIEKLLEGLATDDGTAVLVGRWFSLQSRLGEQKFCIRTDGSPFGMGGILFEHGKPVSWWADEIGTKDLALMQAIAGDSAWQPEWELLAIFLSVAIWAPRMQGSHSCLLQADAKAALGVAERIAGNCMVARRVSWNVRARATDLFLCPFPCMFCI